MTDDDITPSDTETFTSHISFQMLYTANRHHTIIPQISVRLSFDFHGNRSHDALHARPMCCSEPDDVPFLFEFLRIWSTYTIKRLCVVFASLHRQRRCGIPPTVSQEKFIPQLISRVGYRLTKNYIGYPKLYTKLRLTPIYNCTYIYG